MSSIAMRWSALGGRRLPVDRGKSDRHCLKLVPFVCETAALYGTRSRSTRGAKPSIFGTIGRSGYAAGV